jgi:hypothetical protein
MKGLKKLFLLISIVLISSSGFSKESIYNFDIHREFSKPLVDTTFKISGYITDTAKKGISSVSVQISSSSVLVNSAITDAAGYYEFQVKAGLPYIITPTKQDYTFTPLFLRYDPLRTNLTNQNFTGRSKLLIKISGYVKDSFGRAIPLAQITVSGDIGQTRLTDSSGYYEVTLSSGAKITITPSKAGYTFTPPARSYQSIATILTNQNFLAAPAVEYVKITGFVKNNLAQGVSGVLITLSGDGSGTKTTDTNGLFGFVVQSGKNYSITPSKSGYRFDPVFKSFVLLKANVIQNFSAQPTLVFYKISGYITDSLKRPIQGVLLSLSGDSIYSRATDTAGFYQFSVAGGKNYLLTPSKTGYSFTPASRSFTALNIDQTGQNFSAKLVYVSALTPKPIAPLNNSKNQLTTLKIEWDCSSDFVAFHLQIALDSNFTKIILSDTNIYRKYYSFDRFVNNTKYFWRVRSYNVFGKSSWSAVWNFTTAGLSIQPPRPIYPLNNSINIPLSPTFSWAADSSAKLYSLAISSDSSLNSIIFLDTIISKNYKQIGPLNAGTIYFWSIRSQKDDTKSPWLLPAWKFTTVNISLPAPKQKSPTDKSLIQNTYLRIEWDSILNIKSYTLQVSTDSMFSSFVLNSSLSYSQKTLGPLNYNTTYYWRVRAENATGTSPWSSTWSFKIGSQVPLSPTLLKPANYAVDVPYITTLEWKSDSSATSYHLQLSKDIAFSNIQFNDSTILSPAKQITLSSGMIYYWRVSTKNLNGKSKWSSSWKFTTKTAGLEAPKLILPLNGSTNLPLTQSLSWSGNSNAKCYHLQISTDTGFRNVILNDSTISSTSKEIGPLEVGAKYYWKVRANYGTEKSIWSGRWEFSTISPTLSIPTLTSPLDKSTEQPTTVTLIWDLVTGATEYKIQVSTDSLYRKTALDTLVSTNSVTISHLPIGVTFYWRIRAANTAEFSKWSNIWSFSTFLTVPSIPKLVAPINNIINYTVDPYLVWSQTYGAGKYLVHLSTDSTFTIITFDDTLALKTYTAIGTLDYNTKYFWRVKSINNVGVSDWSDTWHFTTIITSPQAIILSTPDDGATNIPINPGPILTWQPVQNLRAYQVQIALDRSFSNVILDKFLTDTKFQLKNLSPRTIYYWRVRAYNTGGKGLWSSARSFGTVDGLPSNPVIIVPSNGATGIDNSVQLRWLSKGNIISYSVEVSKDPGFITSIFYIQSQTSTTLNLSNLSYATSYYWRVKSRNVIGESEWVVSQFTTLAAEREQKNWSPSGTTSTKPPKISCLAKDPFGFIYAGGDSGVYRSPTETPKWDHLGINWDDLNYVTDLTIPSTGDVFAAAIDGIWRLLRSENSWKHIYFSTEVSKISILPNSNILGSLGSGMILSSDNGDNWIQISNLTISGQASCQNISALYTDPNGVAYFGTSINTEQCQSGVVDVFKSNSSGASWQSLGFNNKDNVFGITNITSNTSGDLFVGTSGGPQSLGAVYKYSNGVWARLSLDGQKISFITSLPNGALYASVQSDNSPGILFKDLDGYNKHKDPTLLTGKGVAKSKDGGKTWEQANEGLVDTKTSTINTTEDGKIYVGTADEGVYEGQYSTINKAPYFTTIISDTTIYKNQMISVPVTAADLNQDNVTFKLLNAPNGATLDQISNYTCLFKWTPAENQAGTFSNIMITVTDNILSDTLLYSINVSTVNSQPVFITKIKDTTIQENQTLTFGISAFDPDNNILTFTDINFPAGARLDFLDQNIRTLYWKPVYGAAGVYKDLQISISNGLLANTQSFSITVRKEDRAPSLFTLISPGKSEDLQLTYPAKPIQFTWNSSSDPDDEDVVTYRLRLKGITIDTTIYGISSNGFSFSGMDLLKVSSDYNWFIIASDGVLLTVSDTSTFKTSQNISGAKNTNVIPTSYSLEQNYPNPFNPNTKIQFGLPKTSIVSLEIYNSIGQRVRTLVSNESLDAGIWSFVWDGKNDAGMSVSTGMYFYRLTTQNFVKTRKMILMK